MIKNKKRKNGRLGYLLLAIAVFLISFPFSAGADEENPYRTPVKIGEGLDKKINQRMEEAIKGVVSGKAVIDRGFLLEGMMSNQWIITRSVVNGFGNIADTINYLKSDDVKRATIADLVVADARREAHAQRDLKRVYTEEELRDKIKKINPATFAGSSQALNAQKAFTDELEKLQAIGFFGTGKAGGPKSILDKTKMIAFFILGISLMSRLAFMAYESIVKQSVPPLGWFRVFFKFMALLLIIIFLPNMIMFGVSMSDSIRNFISNTSFGNVDSAGDIVGKLLRAKVDYLGIDPSTSILSIVGSTASMLIASFLGWLSYFIAAAVIFVIVLLGDIMMSLTAVVGPLIAAISLMPSFEANFGNWFKGYITLLFYGPLAAVYSVMLVAILTIGLDTSALAFIIISVAYIVGATNIPNMSKSMSGTVLAGLAIGLASMPMKFATGALTAGAGGAVRSVGAATKGLAGK